MDKNPRVIVVTVLDPRKGCGKTTVINEIEALLQKRASYKVTKSLVVGGEMAQFNLNEDSK